MNHSYKRSCLMDKRHPVDLIRRIYGQFFLNRQFSPSRNSRGEGFTVVYLTHGDAQPERRREMRTWREGGRCAAIPLAVAQLSEYKELPGMVDLRRRRRHRRSWCHNMRREDFGEVNAES